jgi:cysteine-rich repeat protein
MMVVAAGCTDPVGMTDDTTSASSTGDATTGEPTTTTGDDTTGTPTTGDGTTTDDGTTVAPEPVCGNGFVEGEEPCDDGNDVVDDGCDSKCRPTGVPLWTISWDAGFAKNNAGSEVALDADGNIYVAGSLRSEMDGDDAQVRKLDASGEELDRYDYGGPLEQNISALAIGADGSIYMGGQEEVMMDGAHQAWVRKVSPAGVEEWKFTRLTEVVDGYGFVSDIAVDADGVYIVGAETVTDKKNFQMFVHRLDDADGTSVWEDVRPGLTGLSRCGIALAPDGAVYVSAGVKQNTEVYPTLVKLTSDGAEDYAQVYESTLGGFGGAVAVHTDGSVALAGYKVSSDGAADTWLARVDDAGAIVWEAGHDQDFDSDVLLKLAWSSAGDLYVGGYVVVTNQQTNAYVARFTGDGELVWSSIYDDEQSLGDDVASIAVRDDAVVVVGTEFKLGEGYNQWIRAYQP